eukprot:COSAG03_NODE_29398_length_185_cov_13.779070_1_plen_37_part_01
MQARSLSLCLSVSLSASLPLGVSVCLSPEQEHGVVCS